jgi:hypothetical protein
MVTYRLGRHRPRNLYAQHGDEPDDRDVFVALFEDAAMAKRVCRMLNAEEEGVRRAPPFTVLRRPAHIHLGQRSEAGEASSPNRADSSHGPILPVPDEEERRILHEQAKAFRMDPSRPLTPNDECTCGHPYWMHDAGPHGHFCSSPEATDTCVAFERRCGERYIGWASRCTLVVGHEGIHHAPNGTRFGQIYTQRGDHG